MANFLPLKNYILFCLDRLIEQYELNPPFLDIGCGVGDVSRHVAAKGWRGKAIDISPEAIALANKELSEHENISVELKSLYQEDSHFQTIFVFDVLEHLKDDVGALEKISSLLNHGGKAVITVPSNHREWRWDDEFYGHFRRYTKCELSKKLREAQLCPVVFWDFTYPVFWLMRRVYTRLKKKPKDLPCDMTARTRASSMVNSWDIPLLAPLLSRDFILWKKIYLMQFNRHKEKVEKGHEMIVLTEKL